MADGNDTTTTPDGTQDGDASNADANRNASGAGDGDVSTLLSRLSGQTAKVNTLNGENKTLRERLAELESQLTAAQKGTLDKDETTKALTAKHEQEVAALKRENRLARIEGKFPETFSELGEAAANLTDDQLASMEARLRGGHEDQAGGEPPTPRGNNAARQSGSGKSAEEMTSADIIASMRSMPVPDWWPTQG